MSQNANNIHSLFQTAQAENTITAAGAAVLNIPDMGAAIQAGLGMKVDDVQASEVLLVTFLVDDSGSIRDAGNEQVVRDGVNLVLEALGKSKQKDGILACCRTLNDSSPIFPYVALENAPKLDSNNYSAGGGTPLYDQTAVTLGQVLAKSQEFSDAGVPVRTVTVIVTDGADVHSTTHRRPTSVEPLVRDLRRQESHIIAAMGIDDGGRTDFRKVFEQMGIDPRWILLPSNTASDIRKAFVLVSQSAVRASQAAAAFSQVAAGGFGSP